MRATPELGPDYANPAIAGSEVNSLSGGDPKPRQSDDQARRRFRRWSVNLPASVSVLQAPRSCSVFDLSPAGARVRLFDGEALARGTEVVLELDGFGSIPAEVRHTVDGYTGLMFLLDEASEVQLARHLVSMQAERRQHHRESARTEATLRPKSGDYPCVVENISRTGASVLVNDARHLMEGDDLVLRIAGFADIAAVVRRLDEGEVALMFHHEIAGELPFSIA